MGKFDVIKNLIDEGEEFTFQYYDFEFLLADIEKNTFIVKTYCPKVLSYSLNCLEKIVTKEIKKILKYFNLQNEEWDIKLYSGDQLLNGGYYHHFTQDFLDELLEIVEPYKKFEYLINDYETKRNYTLTIEQEPYKVEMESNGYEDVNIIIHSNLIRGYRTYKDTGEVEDCSVDVCNNWMDILESELDFNENWQKVGPLWVLLHENPYVGCTYFDIFSTYNCS